VTTENTHVENNDWQEPVVEQSPASENAAPSPTPDTQHEEERPAEGEARPEKSPAEGAAEGAMPGSSDEQTIHQEEQPSDDQQNLSSLAEQSPADSETSLSTPDAAVAEQPLPAPTTSEGAQAEQDKIASPSLFSLGRETPQVEEEAVRPFTDFIEEFRQTEVRLNALLNEPESSFTSFAGSEGAGETIAFPEITAENFAPVINEAPEDLSEREPQEQPTEEARSDLAQPEAPAERPVSPLLRPATRIRVPRHSRHRVEERVQQAEPPVEQPQPETEPPAEEKAEQPQVEEQPARPARRYRFDRPAATASASPITSRFVTPAAPTRATESKEKRNGAFATPPESVSVEPATIRPEANGVTTPETPTQVLEPAPASAETGMPAAPAPASERRRRGHERQREKEQQTAAAPAVPAAELAAPEVEPAPVSKEEIPVEDLPPLEYSELQAASSRRRRRRRVGSAGTAAANGVSPSKVVLPDLTAPVPNTPAPSAVPPKNVPSAAPLTYNIVSGYTVSQMNQGNDVSGPFMGPEPSPARGSTFGSTPTLRHARAEALRSAPVHPAKQGESPLLSPASVNYLANAIAQSIQNQTDRMVAELRRANQVPTNVSVSLPPFPSTERVGVFVDVANLLYSARTLRLTIDFGKLLDFLRGNRRLVRAQAYCPTSPQPGDDQMFLQAVKGLGYRITTKNYKTFSSGAKKADLDLDLCMDVVRLVDGKAVDCIVLVSGDSDFMPMLDYCSDHGVRVEVAAFDESMSATLRQSCDLFINLSMLEEIRA
jgi:uncharacterized LabA/DUF88 family protein